MRAGFAEVDITPPLGTAKIGWLKEIIPKAVADPLFARAAVFECGGQQIGFIQLDTLSVRWSTVEEVRRRITNQFGFPGERIMVSATHTHGGPAVANCGDVKRDENYLAFLRDSMVEAFGQALGAAAEAEICLGRTVDFAIGHNRRLIMRDGTVCTHGTFANPDALCFEGPIDPEVVVLAARDTAGQMLGCLVNYACHPTHHGGDEFFSAGWPGVMAATLKKQGIPVAMFVNGAGGNVHTSNPVDPSASLDMDQAGRKLAEDVLQAVSEAEWRTNCRVSGRHTTVQLPYRKATAQEIAGKVPGAQRFVDPEIYDRHMPALLGRIESRGTQPAEVQALSLDEFSFVSIPAEYFVQLGLRIKEESYPRKAVVVAWANGMVGYVPHRQAFDRGGYETTFAASSRMAPEAGDILADAAIELIRQEGREQ